MALVDQTALARARRNAGRLLLGMGLLALVLAVLAVLFGEQIKPMGDAGVLSYWQLIALCLLFIGLTDAGIGLFMIRAARRALEAQTVGPKR
jgi:hypothetical protein